MTVPLNAGGTTEVIHLRRGRPRYRVGYLAEVLQYIAAKQRRNGYRPVHIALSVACRELRIGRTTWLRMVRTLEAAHWLRREARTGGEGNKGAVYWLLDPPSGRQPLGYGAVPQPPPPPPLAPVAVYAGRRSVGVDTDAPIRNLIAETVISNTDRTSFHSPRNVPVSSENRIPERPYGNEGGVPLIRIPERPLEGRSRPTDGTTAAAESAEPSTTVAGDNPTSPAQAGAAANPPPSPSLDNGRSAGRGVSIRYSDGTTEIIPRSGPPPDISEAMRDLTRRRY